MLRLRPFKKCDAVTVASWVESEKAMYRWCAGRYSQYPMTGEEINAYYESMAFSDSFFPMAVFDEDGLAGQLTMRFTDEAKRVVRFAHVILDDKKRGRGYGREMVRLCLDYAFDILKADKVSLGVFENNPQALRCYQSVGFLDTGRDDYYMIKGEKWKCFELEREKDSFA